MSEAQSGTICYFLPRSESKIDDLARTSGEKLLFVMITNWCHAARRVWPEVRTAARSRTRAKCATRTTDDSYMRSVARANVRCTCNQSPSD